MEHAHHHDSDVGPGPEPSRVRELLAIRPGGLRDVVRAMPALRYLRSTWPDARISVAAPEAAVDLLAACPYVDRAIALDVPSEARMERFDVAVSFAAPGEEAALPLSAVDAGFRAGWSDTGGGERSGIAPAWPDRLSDSTRMLRLAWLLGGSLQADPELGLWTTLADRNGAARLVEGILRPIGLVHVGAGDAGRRWPADRWGRVIDAIAAAGLEPVLVGTVRDAADTDAAAALATANATSLVGRTSVGELAGLLERAALFVGSDSGPAALAGALGVRSVVVGSVDPLEHVARPGLVDLVDAGPCDTCGERACGHPAPSAERVELERVLARVELAATTALDRWNRTRIS